MTLKIIFLPSLIKVLQSDGEHREQANLNGKQGLKLDKPRITNYYLYLALILFELVSFIAAT
jgi:hypothetical protein